jgi:hypothetical protein
MAQTGYPIAVSKPPTITKGDWGPAIEKAMMTNTYPTPVASAIQARTGGSDRDDSEDAEVRISQTPTRPGANNPRPRGPVPGLGSAKLTTPRVLRITDAAAIAKTDIAARPIPKATRLSADCRGERRR